MKILKSKLYLVLSIFATVLLLTSMLFSMTVLAADNSEAITLINEKTAWRYLDDGTDPAAGQSSLTAWTGKSFNDRSWKSAAGTFGVKNGKLNEVEAGYTPTVLLNLYKDGKANPTIPTYFFRTTFTVDDPSAIQRLSFDMHVDDSMVLYLNGKVIKDTRSGDFSTTNTNLYYAVASDEWEHKFDVITAGNDLLVKGENVLAVQVHNSKEDSSDVYLGVHSVTASSSISDVLEVEQVVLGIGADETQRNLSWMSMLSGNMEVRLAKASSVVGGIFPTSGYASFSARSAAATNPSYYSHKATITGLVENTRYAYTIVYQGQISKIYYFSTGSFGDYSFVFLSDAHVDKPEIQTEWEDTLDKVINNLGATIILSGGDQISTADAEHQFKYFLRPDLAEVTFAPSHAPGHESPSTLFDDHYNLPNVSTRYGVTPEDKAANYWFTYNNTLFMNLNMANKDAITNGEHEAFMREAIAANPNVRWKVVIMHVALFSTGMHGDPNYQYYNNEIKKYRPALAPVISNLDIDVVLSGHDHVYVRTKMMDGVNPTNDTVTSNTVLDPEGTLYICTTSATGSKYYEKKVDAEWIAAENYEERKGAIKVSVTDTSFTITAYHLDDMSAFDTFTITKSNHVCEPELVPEEPASCATSTNGKREYYLCECGKAYEESAATTLIRDIAAWGTIYPKHQYDNICDAVCNVSDCAFERTVPDHVDRNNDLLCDKCDVAITPPSSVAPDVPDEPEDPDEPEEPEDPSSSDGGNGSPSNVLVTVFIAVGASVGVGILGVLAVVIIKKRKS